MRIEPAELYQQIHKGQFLGLCAGVLGRELADGLAWNVLEATDVDDADTVRVVPLAVSACDIDVTAEVDTAVAVDDIVIPDIAPTVTLRLGCRMPLTYLVDCVVLTFRRGGAMYQDKVDAPSGAFKDDAVIRNERGLLLFSEILYLFLQLVKLLLGFLGIKEDPGSVGLYVVCHKKRVITISAKLTPECRR